MKKEVEVSVEEENGCYVVIALYTDDKALAMAMFIFEKDAQEYIRERSKLDEELGLVKRKYCYNWVNYDG